MRKWSVLLFLLVLVSVVAVAESTERSFDWEYAGRSWSLEIPLSVTRYRFFGTQPRQLGHENYTDYITDARDDADIAHLVEQLGKLAADAGLNTWQRLNCVMAFVQSIPYEPEETEYPRYPLETLYEQRGDCEDTSILAAAILRQMGFDVILLAFTTEQHMAIGIAVTPPECGDYQSYAWNGKDYYYLETTFSGWDFGQRPAGLASAPSIVGIQATSLASPQRR